MAEFWSMGGYAAFVWPAYGVSLLVLAAVAIWTLSADRRVRRQLGDNGGRRP